MTSALLLYYFMARVRRLRDMTSTVVRDTRKARVRYVTSIGLHDIRISRIQGRGTICTLSERRAFESLQQWVRMRSGRRAFRSIYCSWFFPCCTYSTLCILPLAWGKTDSRLLCKSFFFFLVWSSSRYPTSRFRLFFRLGFDGYSPL